MERQYISEVIGNEYTNWNSSNPNMRHILISGGTGTGKTHFVMNTLLDYCTASGKSILYLCNRKALLNQIEAQLRNLSPEKQKHITATLYQRYSQVMRQKESISRQYGSELLSLFLSMSQQNENSFTGLITKDLFKQIFNTDKLENPVAKWLDLTVTYLGCNISYICRFEYRHTSVFADLKKYLSLLKLQTYDYVIFDEIHYLLQDSEFSFKTADMFNIICEPLGSKTTAVFITATPEGVERMILGIISDRYPTNYPGIFLRKYSIPPDYRHTDAHVLSSDSELVDEILASANNDRWLIFVDSKKHGNDLEERIDRAYAGRTGFTLKPCKFIYRKAYVDSELKKMQRTGAFADTKCLISTSILDNGISIEHPDFHHIVIETWDSIEFIQMLGRKRLMPDEHLQLYIYERTPQEIEMHRRKINARLAIINEALNANAANIQHPQFEFISKYCRNIRTFSSLNGLVRFTPSGFDVNLLAKLKLEMQRDEYMKIKLFPYFNSLAKYQLSLIEIDPGFILNMHFEHIITLLENARDKEKDFAGIRELIAAVLESLKKMNDKNAARFHRVGSSTSVRRMNEWLKAAGTGFIIEDRIADKHSKRKVYKVVKRSEIRGAGHISSDPSPDNR